MTAAVTSAEAELLTLARAAFTDVSPSELQRLLVTPIEPPGKLGPTARRLLEQLLARGLVTALAKCGGWRKVEAKRLWERSGAPELRFTGNLVHLLAWMLRHPLAERDLTPLTLKGPLTPGEEAFVVLLYARLLGTGCEGALARQAALRSSPLCVLAFAGELAREQPLEAVPTLDVARSGAFVEGLSDLLAAAWVRVERAKPGFERPATASAVGDAQAATLQSFLGAVEAAGRRDLADFLISAAVDVLATSPPSGNEYVASMSADAPLRDRAAARRSSAAFLRALARLRTWDHEHRSVRFIDDGYQLAQHLVGAWERLGDPGFRTAERIVAELDAVI